MIVQTMKCMLCGNTGTIEVDDNHYKEWINGKHIQHAFPELDASQRELLMTGTHAHCWETMFKEDEDA